MSDILHKLLFFPLDDDALEYEGDRISARAAISHALNFMKAEGRRYQDAKAGSDWTTWYDSFQSIVELQPELGEVLSLSPDGFVWRVDGEQRQVVAHYLRENDPIPVQNGRPR